MNRQINSTPVISAQTHPHKNLQRRVARYIQTDYINSIPNYVQEEFSLVNSAVQQRNQKVILDSGCGTGESAFKLARLYPQKIVVAVDKSANRLQRSHVHGEVPINLIFVRCNLVYFWQMVSKEKWNIAAHYLFYPNPWPKPGHLKRRWHAHPIFPTLIKLGGVLTMRTNWKIYADEFALALQSHFHVPVFVNKIVGSDAFTAFERKYMQSDHDLYQVTFNLSEKRRA